MNRTKLERQFVICFVCAFSLTLCIPLVIYALTKNIPATLIALAGFAVLCGILYGVRCLFVRYVFDVVSDMSDLMDMFSELEERQLFPENEETIVTKLQSKAIRLVQMLRKQQKTALQEQEDIKSLVSDISHQLKTPIANLMMYSSFLEDETLKPAQQKEYIGILRISVERLHFLSESMIKISRLESGLIHMNMQKQSLNETALKAAKDVFSKAKKKGTEIQYVEEEQIILPHDRNWTAEAIFNLLDNAVKYAQFGSTVILSIKRFGMFASVEVRDENAPIPEKERSRIFSRFYRGQNSRNQEGIGIGLYLTREIAVKQGGYINLKVTEHGNIFSIVLQL